MTLNDALNAIHFGCTVKCTVEEYPAIRTALQDAAGKYIDNGDPVRAQIALMEVRRLDELFDQKL